MIIEHTEGNLTIRYDYAAEQLSLILHHSALENFMNKATEDEVTQINIGHAGMARLSEILEIVMQNKNFNWNKIAEK